MCCVALWNCRSRIWCSTCTWFLLTLWKWKSISRIQRCSLTWCTGTATHMKTACKQQESVSNKDSDIWLFFFSQDRKGLPELPWPAPDVAPEHGGETLWEREPRWGGPLSGPQRSAGGRIPQHAGGLPLPAHRMCHLSGQCTLLEAHSPCSSTAEWDRKWNQDSSLQLFESANMIFYIKQKDSGL